MYGAIGRVVALSALLEERHKVLLARLTGAQLEAFADLGASAVARIISRVGRMLASEMPGWSTLASDMDDALKAFGMRNDAVHNLWPAQGGDRLLGHRHSPEEGSLFASSGPWTPSDASSETW